MKINLNFLNFVFLFDCCLYACLILSVLLCFVCLSVYNKFYLIIQIVILFKIYNYAYLSFSLFTDIFTIFYVY